MTSEQAFGAVQSMLPQIRMELETTRRVLAAVPDDQAAYKPHEKSMSAGELSQHIASSTAWFLQSILAGAFNAPSEAESQRWKAMRPSEVAAAFSAEAPQLLEQAGQLSGEQLAKETEFHGFINPLAVYLGFMNSHAIHHRGQLSVYLRPMGAKVPSIYGSSADETFQAAARS